MSRSPRQESLSDPVNSSELTITDVLTHAKPQTKQQAIFQRLIRQIDEQRAQVAEWHTYSERYGQRVGSELMPLFAQLREKRIAMLHLLDTQFHQSNVVRGKQQRAKLCDIILNLAHELLLEQRDEEIVALYDRYSDFSYDDQAGIDKAVSQDVIEELFGVRLDDDNANVSMEEMLAKAMRQRQEEEVRNKTGSGSRRRKSAKQAAAEEKRAAVKKEISQSVREIYRKLASSLHPDRASTDLTVDEKTTLMQRVNQAYDRSDLLELLNIQLEIEQIDTNYLTNLPDERIEHYIQVLREQLAELQVELASLLMPYRQLVQYTQKIRPTHVDKAMDAEITRLEMDLRQADIDLIAFQDAKQLAAFIKYYQVDNGFDEFDELQMLGDLLSSFSVPPARRRKR
ncbi:J domain-containing protein [Nitrosomonas sp.]|uniref:J domain-containing protein n=1 Tax=Nitrosomonas sp. TaxID=42353 RepID=UPI0025F0A7CB|nr:J domain-containing protein [Nitrosomonas sp.]MCC6916107.1 J domain-containing protein [Nitrosomonas sp.]